MLSPVSFADVNRTASTVHEDNLTRRASANEGWKSCDNRNLWLDTLDDDCLSSDEDQNDSSNYSERNVRFKKDRFSSSTALFLILPANSDGKRVSEIRISGTWSTMEK